MKNYFFATGKSQIKPDEWAVLCDKYKRVVGKEYCI